MTGGEERERLRSGRWAERRGVKEERKKWRREFKFSQVIEEEEEEMKRRRCWQVESETDEERKEVEDEGEQVRGEWDKKEASKTRNLHHVLMALSVGVIGAEWYS